MLDPENKLGVKAICTDRFRLLLSNVLLFLW